MRNGVGAVVTSARSAHYSGCCLKERNVMNSCRSVVNTPLRAAEQRSHAGGSRRGLSESSRGYREGEFRSRPAWRAAQARAHLKRSRSAKRRRTWGRLSLVTFFGGAKKVTSCRAAPGELEVLFLSVLIGLGLSTFAAAQPYPFPSPRSCASSARTASRRRLLSRASPSSSRTTRT